MEKELKIIEKLTNLYYYLVFFWTLSHFLFHFRLMFLSIILCKLKINLLFIYFRQTQ
jgi:hypothetical protein